jgi:hypothetical protein
MRNQNALNSSWLTAWAALAIVFGASNSARAEKFSNEFIEFEKPANWTCLLEGAEFVCQSNDAAKKKEAIIVFAAKLKGDQDSLKQYLDYLSNKKVYTSATGKAVESDKKAARNTIIREQPWVDALHYESEIPGYFTRYLATIYKDEIGVLVTYSVVKDKYNDYIKLFEPMVSTLKVFRTAKAFEGLNSVSSNGLPNVNIGGRLGNEALFGQAQSVQGGGKEKTEGAGEGGGGAAPLLLLLLLGAGAIFFLKKKKG